MWGVWCPLTPANLHQRRVASSQPLPSPASPSHDSPTLPVENAPLIACLLSLAAMVTDRTPHTPAAPPWQFRPSLARGKVNARASWRVGGGEGAGLLQEGGRTLRSAGRCWVTMPHRQQMTTGLIWSDCLIGKGWNGRGIIWPQFRVSMFCLFEYLDNVGYLDGPISFIYSCYSFIIIMLLFASRRVWSFFTDTSLKLSKCVHIRSPRLPRYPNCCLFLSL